MSLFTFGAKYFLSQTVLIMLWFPQDGNDEHQVVHGNRHFYYYFYIIFLSFCLIIVKTMVEYILFENRTRGSSTSYRDKFNVTPNRWLFVVCTFPCKEKHICQTHLTNIYNVPTRHGFLAPSAQGGHRGREVGREGFGIVIATNLLLFPHGFVR